MSGRNNCFPCAWQPDEAPPQPCRPTNGEPLVSFLLQADDCSAIDFAPGRPQLCDPNRWEIVNSTYTVKWPKDTCFERPNAERNVALANASPPPPATHGAGHTAPPVATSGNGNTGTDAQQAASSQSGSASSKDDGGGGDSTTVIVVAVVVGVVVIALIAAVATILVVRRRNSGLTSHIQASGKQDNASNYSSRPSHAVCGHM